MTQIGDNTSIVMNSYDFMSCSDKYVCGEGGGGNMMDDGDKVTLKVCMIWNNWVIWAHLWCKPSI